MEKEPHPYKGIDYLEEQIRLEIATLRTRAEIELRKIKKYAVANVLVSTVNFVLLTVLAVLKIFK